MKNILNTLQKIQNSESSNSDLVSLFSACFNIAKLYLRKNHKKFSFLKDRNDYNFEDAAIEIVTPLFLERNGRKCDRLIEAFDKWQPPIQNDSDAFFFLHQLIFIRTEHHLTRALEKADPVYAFYLRKINGLINQQRYYKIRFLGRSLLSVSERIPASASVIDEDNLNIIPINLFILKKNHLDNLFEFIVKETKFFPAIAINMLIGHLRRFEIPDYDEIESGDYIIEKLSVDEAVEYGFLKAKSKLHSSYVLKNKIDNHEMEAFHLTLQDFAHDLRNGGLSPGLFEYLSKHLPALNREAFKIKYENILEYLLKIMKLSIEKYSEK